MPSRSTITIKYWKRLLKMVLEEKKRNAVTQADGLKRLVGQK